jgi:hypothetical protein
MSFLYAIAAMTIEFSCEKLLLSPRSFELLSRPNPIGIAVVKQLLSIDLGVKIDLEPYRDACSISYLAALPIRIYHDLLSIEHECGFSRSEIVDGLVKAKCDSILPAIRLSALIAGKTEIGILASDKNRCAYSWQRFTSDGCPVREGESRQESSTDLETYQLPYGCLIKRWRGNKSYWYWQYYRVDGSRADDYMHKNLDGAIARVKSIGIPGDAKPQRLHKSKKIWELKCS